MNIKVVVVDADITMTNLELITGIEKRKTNLHEVLVDQAPVSNAIYLGPRSFKIITSGIPLNDIQLAKLDNLKKSSKVWPRY